MEADPSLDLKRPKYDEIILQKLEGDRRKNDFTKSNIYLLLWEIAGPKRDKKKKNQ